MPSDTAPAFEPVVHGHTGLEILDEHDCLQLLRSAHLGRLALSMRGLPAIFPVHYALLGRDPVFRTGDGDKLAAASAGNILCFEIDHHDNETHQGWSVTVTGPARVVTDPDELAAVQHLPLRPWVGGGDTYVVVEAALLSGRRIGAPGPLAS
jgi:hypothetical protein